MKDDIKPVPFNRETKLVLLQALKRGYFTAENFVHLREFCGLKTLQIEIIDNRDKVDKNNE